MDTEVKPAGTSLRVGHAQVELVPARVGRGRVEVEAAPGALQRLQECAADLTCRVLLLVAVIAQVADASITNLALHRGFVEENGFMRLLVFNPALSAAVKAAVVIAITAVAALRLPVRQLRVALAVAAGLSMVGPAVNALQLLHG
jgi:hypothetical protein